MPLKSAFQDVKETTLSAVSGLLGKLSYLASLRRVHGRYEHWGLQMVYGQEPCERALRAAHSEVVAGVLRMPLDLLTEDLQHSSQESGVNGQEYVQEMREHFEDLLPEGRSNTPASSHLNSVLLALWSLEKSRGRATRSTS